jgi:hypothetical protein
VRYDEEAEPTSAAATRDWEEDVLNFAVDNYRRQRGFTWAARYSADRAEYEDLDMPWEYAQALLEIGAWVRPWLRVFAGGGKESAWDQPLDSSLQDTFWEVGFARAAVSGLRFEFAAGERTFGDSWRGLINYTSRRITTDLAYGEQPTSQSRTNDFLTDPDSRERYIQKRFGWNFAVVFPRSTVSLAVFDETREERFELDGTPLDDQAQQGATLAGSWRAGTRTTFTLGVRRIIRELASAQERDFSTALLGVRYRFGQRTELSLDYEHSAEEETQVDPGSGYTANLISLFLTRGVRAGGYARPDQL